MSAAPQTVVHFYATHPINEAQIFHALEQRGIPLDQVTEDHLKEHDQDHYGGIAALELLARKAGIRAEHHVLDVCSGVGGPARYLAYRYGCRVMGIDLTASRHATAQKLTHLAKLDDRVRFRMGDAQVMPFPDATFDVVVGQEAWVHVPDKGRLIRECVRVLKPGGMIAFTDILRRVTLAADVAARLREGMAFATPETLDGYAALLTDAGCAVTEREDLSAEWTDVLRGRLAMYRSLQADTMREFGEAHYRRYDESYTYFVGLYAEGVLGGGRIVARKA
jgi:sarcosine/dimethylglycine N-methyltransferase